MTVRHDRRTFCQGELARAGNGSTIDGTSRIAASAGVNSGVIILRLVGVACVEVVPDLVHELNRRRTMRRFMMVAHVLLSDIILPRSYPKRGHYSYSGSPLTDYRSIQSRSLAYK